MFRYRESPPKVAQTLMKPGVFVIFPASRGPEWAPPAQKKHIAGIPDLAARKNHIAGIPGRPREKKIISRESPAAREKKSYRGNPGPPTRKRNHIAALAAGRARGMSRYDFSGEIQIRFLFGAGPDALLPINRLPISIRSDGLPIPNNMQPMDALE